MNVNFIGWMVSWGVGVYGAGHSYWLPWIYMMFGRGFARHEHFVVGRVHCSSHGEWYFRVSGCFCCHRL